MGPDWEEGAMAEDRNNILTRRMDSFICEILTKRPSSKRYYQFISDVVVYMP